jgi:hypothetical protein
MSGLAVYQDSPESLKSIHYGYDGTSAKVIKVDSNGRMYITTEIGTTVEVNANDFDIRNLSNTQDNIAVYGNDGTTNRILKTNDSGALQVTVGMNFTNQTENVTSADDYAGSTQRDISLQRQFSFFISNTGTNSAIVKVQISPDGTFWVDDSAEFTIAAATAQVLGPNKFANYARISFKSATTGSSTGITITYQSQA